MKYIITEEQYRKLNRSSQSISDAIVKYMTRYIGGGNRKVTPKARNYGNLRENWCVDGKEVISAYYFFEDGGFDNGYLMVSKGIVDVLTNALSVRKSYVLHVILEWYDETMVPKFEQIVGIPGLSIDDIDISESQTECTPEPKKPEGITDEEMINYIINNTLYSRERIMEKIESGEDLEDIYLHVLDIWSNRRNS